MIASTKDKDVMIRPVMNMLAGARRVATLREQPRVIGYFPI
jgi:hypothetical protein